MCLALPLLLVVGGDGLPSDTGAADPGSAEATDRLPDGWDLSELARATLREDYRQPYRVRVLVWEVTEDRRPLYVELCVVWAHWQDASGPQWRLAHLYRHPREEGPPPAWRYAVVDDAPFPWRRTFGHPPNNGDVYRFLEDIRWEFRATDGFELRDAGVCASSWHEVIGQPPERFYNRASLKPG